MEKFMKNPYRNIKRELSIEKIKIEENPKLKKYLKEFFNNPNQYFNDTFDNKLLIIGKLKSFEEKYEVPIPKKYQRKFHRRFRTRTNMILNEAMIKELQLFRQKRREFKGTIESSLKEGQRYINDKEIEDIFKAFGQVQEINKDKIKNFITTKELIDCIYVNHNDDLLRNKKRRKTVKSCSSVDEFKNMNNKVKEKNNFKNQSIINKDKDKLIKSKSSIFNSIKKNQNNNPILLINNKHNNYFKNKLSSASSRLKDSSSQIDFEYKKQTRLIPNIKTQNKPFVSLFDEETLKNNYFNNLENNNTIKSHYSTIYNNRHNSSLITKKFTKTTYQLKEEREKEKIKINLLENEKLMEKQSQFLPNTSQELIKNEIAKRLASQEKALIYNKKNTTKQNNILDSLSKKLKKQKSELMLGKIEDYRITKDIKIKLNRLIKKITPGLDYNWKLDLRNTKNEDEIENSKISNEDINDYYNNKFSFSKNDEITRNPFYKTFYSSNKSFRIHDKDYLKSRVSKTLYDKFMKDIDGLKNNYDELLIEGQSLLKCEHDIIKKIKGKKIINNYEINLQPQDINDELYAKNFGVHKFNKN